jgi:predicted metal-dependent peptidase
MIHESLHISLKHMYRRPEWCCNELWNEATDYVINGWIYESKNYGSSFTLPEKCLKNKRYWGWAAEKVAKDLLDNGWEEPPEGTDTRVRPGDVMDAEEEGDELENAEAELDERIADASLLEKSIGHGKGGMMTKIVDQIGKTSTSEYIRHWLQTRYSSPNKSLARPNRRFVYKKIYLPTPKKQVEKLHVCIDSSASVGRSELADYRAQIVRYAKELGLNIIRVAYVDSRVHENVIDGGIWHDIVLDGASPDSIELNVHGGGGTSFDPIFNRIEEEGEEVTALVYMTDGYGSVSVNEPTYPVLWLTSGVEPDFYRTSRWGEHVKLCSY